MLNSIKIRNFKAIQDELDSDGKVIREKPLELKNLARVNYLVGPNGCGKSSVLEGVHQAFRDIRLPGNPEITKNNFDNTNLEKGQITFCNYPNLYNYGGLNTSILLTTSDRIIEKLKESMLEEVRELEKLQKNKNRVTVDGKMCEVNHLFENVYGRLEGFESKNFFKSFDSLICEKFKNDDVNIPSFGEKKMKVLSELVGYFEDYSLPELIIIEEIENSIHPKNIKNIPKIIQEIYNNRKPCCIAKAIDGKSKDIVIKPNLQFLISTHSPFIIREALELENQNVYHIKNGQVKNMLNKKKVKNDGVLTFDRAIADLGFEMRDIYYPNCLIYVEGPVDKIYIEYWLKKYIEVENKEDLKRNFDYEFVEYGGSLASHLAFDPAFKEVETSDDDFKHKLFNVFSLNRRVFFITDNDANTKNAFHKTKKRIEIVLKELENCEFYKESNPKIDTIEKYLKKKVEYSNDKNNKLNVAVINVKNWHKNKIGFEGFKPEAKTLAEKIYNFIIQK